MENQVVGKNVATVFVVAVQRYLIGSLLEHLQLSMLGEHHTVVQDTKLSV